MFVRYQQIKTCPIYDGVVINRNYIIYSIIKDRKNRDIIEYITKDFHLISVNNHYEELWFIYDIVPWRIKVHFINNTCNSSISNIINTIYTKIGYDAIRRIKTTSIYEKFLIAGMNDNS